MKNIRIVYIIYIIIIVGCHHVYGDLLTDSTERVSIDGVKYTSSYDPYDLHPQKYTIPSFSQSMNNNQSSLQYDYDVENDADGWWEVRYTSHRIFDQIRNHRLYLRKVEIDTSLVHTCYEYKTTLKLDDIIIESSSFCYPAIVITGVPKCSTSAMFALLSAPSFILSNTVKENCAFVSASGILEYFASLPKSVYTNQYHIDGCIDVAGNIKLRKLLHNPNTFYIVMVRNYVDMIWSGYNYWCDPLVEEKCDPGSLWADPAAHVRTPELFHDIILADIYKNQSDSLIIPHRVKNPCSLATSIYRSYLDFVYQHIPEDATMVIASEELEQNPAAVWRRLVNATGLPSFPEPNFHAFGKIRYNTQVQADRGADISIAMDTYSPGKYTISGNMPILEQSRKVLDRCWHDDCMAVSRLTGFQYHACKDQPTSTIIESTSPSSSSTAGDSMKSNQVMVSSMMTSSSMNDQKLRQFHGYLKRRVLSCYHLYGEASGLAPITYKHTYTISKRSILSDPTITTIHANHHHRDFGYFRRQLSSTSSETIIYSKQVLIIADNIQDHAYFRLLLQFSYGQDIIYQTSSSNYSQQHQHMMTCDNALVIATSVDQIERFYPSSEHTSKIWFQLKGSHMNASHPCMNRVFSRIMMTRNDALEDAWDYFIDTYYRKTTPSSSGSKYSFEGSVEEWDAWDRRAADIVTNMNYTRIVPLGGNNIFQDVKSDDIYLIIVSHLIASSKKFHILQSMINFIQSSINSSYMTSSSMTPSLLSMNSSHLSCSFALAQILHLQQTQYHHDKQLLSKVFTSKGLLCIIQDHFHKQHSSHLISFPRPFTCMPRYDNSSRIQTSSYDAIQAAVALDTSSPMIDAWKCDARYHRRHYIEGRIKHHVHVLIAPRSYDTIRTRLLFEYASGLYTGSVETDNFMASIFTGEFACGQRLGMIHMRWTSRCAVTVTRGVTPAIKLSLGGKRKCVKGMVRGFTRVLLQVNDPFYVIYDKYLDSILMSPYDSMNHTTGVFNYNTSAWYDFAVDYMRYNYSAWELGTYLVYEQMSRVFNETNVYAFSSDALIYAGYDASSSAIHNRYHILSQMMDFSGHHDIIDHTRMYCAYSFLDLKSRLLDLDSMMAAYLSNPDLICIMKRHFDTTIQSHIQIHHLFANEQC